jgi:two-component system OmpR family response regulator
MSDNPKSENMGDGNRIRNDRLGMRILLDGNPVKLTATEYDLLSYLMDNPGIVVRERLYKAMYGQKMLKMMTNPPSIDVMDVFVCKLRAKFRALNAPDVIRTRHGIGYSFAGWGIDG